MIRFCLITSLFSLLLLPCGCSSETHEASDLPVARSGNSGRQAGLTDSEITDFLGIIRELPGGEFPHFQPMRTPPVGFEQEPEAAIQYWRECFRRSCEPTRLAQSWHSQAELQQILTRRGYTPEKFADLVRRISLSITAASLSSRINLNETRSRVDRQILEMSQAVHQLDVAPDARQTLRERLQRREALMMALQETTALSEFLALLEDVPPQAMDVAHARRRDLQPLLPAGGNSLAQFERLFESNAVVVPASYWQPE